MSKVDQKLRARHAGPMCMAVAISSWAHIRLAVSGNLRSTYCGLMGPRIVSTVRYGGVRHIRLPQSLRSVYQEEHY
jgi:hypothetical protein